MLHSRVHTGVQCFILEYILEYGAIFVEYILEYDATF